MSKSATKADKNVTGGGRFAIVPADVLTYTKLSRGARWCFAVLCSHANKQSICRRSLKGIAAAEGVSKRAVQNWIHELEAAGRIEKLNGAGKTGEYLVVRNADDLDKTRAKNLPKVLSRHRQFSEYGKRGASKKAENKLQPVNESSPPPVQQGSPPGEAEFTGTEANDSSPITIPSKQFPLNNRPAMTCPQGLYHVLS